MHIHSKVVVLDPFGKLPVVMTGSHNLGYKASSKNDDNLMIIEGNAPLAAAFAANIIAIYQAYRWNAYVEAHRQDPKVWHGLVDTDAWQDDYLAGYHLGEIQFWLGAFTAAAAPVGGAPATGTTPRTATATGPSPDAGKRTRRSPAKKVPAKKAAAKKRKTPAKRKMAAKKKTVAKRKAAKKKTPVKRKTAAKKKPVASKRASTKKATKKKTAKKRTR